MRDKKIDNIPAGVKGELIKKCKELTIPPVASADCVPPAMKTKKQFVVWVYKVDLTSTKPAKVPLNIRTGRLDSAGDSRCYLTLEDAIEFALKNHRKVFFWGDNKIALVVAGIGIALVDGCGIIGIDMDNCIVNDKLTPEAQEIIGRFNSYTEISPSGKGIRIFVLGDYTPSKNKNGNCEIYTTKRFLTITGKVYEGRAGLRANDEAVEWYCKNCIGVTQGKEPIPSPATTSVKTYDALEIEIALDKARQAKNKEKFVQLYDNGDASAYSSPSEADSALLCILAHFLNCDPVAIDTAYRMSALYKDRSSKWDSKRGDSTWGRNAITAAILFTQAQAASKSHDGDASPQVLAMRETLEKIGLHNLAYFNSKIYLWNGSFWQRTDDENVKKSILEIQATKNNKLSASFMRDVLSLIKTECYRDIAPTQVARNSIFVENGVLAFTQDGWELQPHERENYNVSTLAVEYAPEAQAPQFCMFLHDVFKDDDDRHEKMVCVLEAIGYSMLQTCCFEKFFMLTGRGANGKSVLLNVIRQIFGQNNTSAVQLNNLDHRFQRAHLYGKYINIISEIPVGQVLNDGTLKAVVSGDMITAEYKMKDAFEFQPFCKFWFSTNHLPHTRDSSDAFFRRSILLTFNRVFEKHEAVKDLDVRLATEASGILNLALAALHKAIVRGFLTEPASSKEYTEKWRYEADQVLQFMDECTVKEAQATASCAEIFQRYQVWGESSGIKQTYNKANLLNRIEILGFKRARNNSSRFFRGFKVRPAHSFCDASDSNDASF